MIGKRLRQLAWVALVAALSLGFWYLTRRR
jgi:EamA domain-containing membrane protein RarD